MNLPRPHPAQHAWDRTPSACPARLPTPEQTTAPWTATFLRRGGDLRRAAALRSADARDASLTGSKNIFRVLIGSVLCCLAFSPCAADSGGEALRFAWLTDTHVGSSTGAEDLLAAVRDINRQGDLSFVLVSGDVTEMGSTAQLLEAKKILDDLRVPVYAIPGNHDTKWSESGGTAFAQFFGRDRFSFTSHGRRFIGLHQGPRMRMAEGHWAPEDLRWLDSLLLTDRTTPVLFVTHYPVDSSIANWYEVLDRLTGFCVPAVLVGHGHQNGVLEFDGLTGIMSRSTLRGRAAHGGYTVLTLTADSLLADERDPAAGSATRWLARGIRRDRYAGMKSRRPSFAVNGMFPRVRTLWTYDTRYTVSSAPACEGDLIVVGDASGTVTAMSARSGTPLWRAATGGPVVSTPAIAGDAVVIGSTDGTILCLDARDGRRRWSVATGAPVVATAAIAARIVFLGGSDRKFRALDLASGAALWTTPGIGAFMEARPAVDGNHVIIGAWDGSLYCFDRATGRVQWKWQGGTPGALYSPAACWPVVSHGKVFIVAPDRAMTILDMSTGNQLWRSMRYEVRESIGVSSDSALVYIRTMRDSIIALRTDSIPPGVQWTSVTGFGYDINPAFPVEGNGGVYHATMRGFLYALDPAHGAVRWSHRASAVLVHTPVPLAGRRILTADMNGVVRMLGEE